MKSYIGIKTIKASPMTRQAYNDLRGWTLPADENGNDEGYLVEYTDGGKQNHPDFAGYISWSPNDVFERAYRPVADGMSFSKALEILKSGRKVAREGWNGKGLWLELQRPDAHSKMTLPYLYINYPADAKTTPGARVPWIASHTDVLADDWVLVD